MRAVLQRVSHAAVHVVDPGAEPDGLGDFGQDGAAGEEPGSCARQVARIGPGLLVLVGFSGNETAATLDWAADKIVGLRLFGPRGVFDRSLLDTGGELLVVSQFTLLGALRKGRRPDFAAAAPAERARGLYDDMVGKLAARLPGVQQGVFGALMHVSLVNDGPATFLLERD